MPLLLLLLLSLLMRHCRSSNLVNPHETVCPSSKDCPMDTPPDASPSVEPHETVCPSSKDCPMDGLRPEADSR